MLYAYALYHICVQELYSHSTFCQTLRDQCCSVQNKGKTVKQTTQTVIGKFCKACRMKLLTTRPSFMCIRGPNVLNILATRTVTFSYNYSKLYAIVMCPFISPIEQIFHNSKLKKKGRSRQRSSISSNGHSYVTELQRQISVKLHCKLNPGHIMANINSS